MSSKKDVINQFTQEQGVIHLGGIDALVRLTLDQVRTDARRGLRTGMFVSGYRGSPVGMLDAALLKQQKLLLSNHIHFVDGLNEDLAATVGSVGEVSERGSLARLLLRLLALTGAWVLARLLLLGVLLALLIWPGLVGVGLLVGHEYLLKRQRKRYCFRLQLRQAGVFSG